MNWAHCKQPANPVTDKLEQQQTRIEADGASGSPNARQITFSGKVKLQQPGQTLYANLLRYNRSKQLVEADEKLLIQLRDLKVLGQNGWFNLDKKQGKLEQVEFRIPSQKARGTASTVIIDGPLHSRYQNPAFTTCPPGNNGFLVSAREMDIDKEQQVGTFKSAKLHFLGVPIFYAPTLSIPLSDARKSGVLVPSIGYSSDNGADISIPYYFNLAPNYDATLTPRLLSNRGLLLGGELRFLTSRNQGDLRAEILPDDRLYDGESSRGSFHANGLTRFSHGISATADINWVSDNHYLEDLGNSLAVTSTRFLRNRLALNWSNLNWDVVAEATHYDTLDETIPAPSRPYSLLPRMRVNWQHPMSWGGLDYAFSGEFTHFYRKDSITGQRIDLQPRLSLPLRRSWGYIEPAANLRYTAYALHNVAAGQPENPDRSTYSLSLDSSLYFDRAFSLGEHKLTQTLEPRAYYLYTPYVKQSNLPLFDTGYLDFNFDNLFRDNRFNGPDRVGDANQLTLALSSRILAANDGRELLRADIGQIYYFSERRVGLHTESGFDSSTSSLIAAASTELMKNWNLRAAVQYDPNAENEKLRQGLAQATYHGDAGRLLNASWRLREGLLEQTDLSGIWPLTDSLSVIGRWYYSLQEEHTLEAVAGLEYNACCWSLRTVFRRYLDSNGIDHDNSVLLQLEFRGLGALGNNIDTFLDRAIYGY